MFKYCLGLSLTVVAAWAGPLLVSSINGNSILAFDNTTGAPLGVFASGGGISAPYGLAFGPDSNLYVASDGNSGIYRFNGVTGASMGLFASGGGLNGVIGITFGPDGNLYADSIGTNQVLRYNGTTGAFMIHTWQNAY
jgi:WD40 repeat protein